MNKIVIDVCVNNMATQTFIIQNQSNNQLKINLNRLYKHKQILSFHFFAEKSNFSLQTEITEQLTMQHLGEMHLPDDELIHPIVKYFFFCILRILSDDVLSLNQT